MADKAHRKRNEIQEWVNNAFAPKRFDFAVRNSRIESLRRRSASHHSSSCGEELPPQPILRG